MPLTQHFHSDPATAFQPGRESARIAEALLRMAARVLDGRDAPEIVSAMCDALVQATPHIRLAWTWFGPADTHEMRPQVTAGPAAQYANQLVIQRTRLTETGPAFRALSGKSVLPFAVSPASSFGPWRDATLTHGIRSALALPLHSTFEPHRGVFVLYADVPDYFDQVGIGIFEGLASLIGSVLSVAAERAALERTAQSDALTGLFNRHSIGLFERKMQRDSDADAPASVLLIDVDHFKRINDAFGHLVGDEVLSALAELLRGAVRKGDGVLRWGGEEFLVCLPDTDTTGALHIAEKIRARVQLQSPAICRARQLLLTVSVGEAAVRPAEALNTTIARADLALYAAKNAGRNRVVAHHEE